MPPRKTPPPSKGANLISEIRDRLDEAEATLKNFEKDIEDVGHFTDLAHLNIARIHLGEFLNSLEVHRSNFEERSKAARDAAAAEDEPEQPEDLRELPKTDLKDEAAARDLPVSGTKEDLAARIADHDASSDDQTEQPSAPAAPPARTAPDQAPAPDASQETPPSS